MKKRLLSLILIPALLLTLCFSSVAYAEINSGANKNDEGQHEVTIMYEKCPACTTGAMRTTKTYTPWSVYASTDCHEHLNCTVLFWTRYVTTTYACASCGYGYTDISHDIDERHTTSN